MKGELMQIKVIKYDDLEKICNDFLADHQNEYYVSVADISELINKIDMLKTESVSYAVIEQANIVHQKQKKDL